MNDEKPLFVCFTNQEEEGETSFLITNKNITDVVNQAIEKLGVVTTRSRWSGYDFFGLTRSDVISYFKAKNDSNIDTETDDKENND